MKKEYIKPSMEVHSLPGRQLILCYSDGPLSYMPSHPEDDEHLMA